MTPVLALRVIPLPAFAIATITERRTDGNPSSSRPAVFNANNAFGFLADDRASGTPPEPDNFAGQWRRIRDELGVPDISSHGFRKTVATLIDDAGLSARIGADHLGHAKVSMTQDRHMSRG